MLQVMYERRAKLWIFLALLIYTKVDLTLAAPPDLASELTVEAITTTSAKVKWDQTPVGNPPTYDTYEVSISPSAGINFQPGPLLSATSANPETTISGLTAGNQYTISVRTVKGRENGTAKTITFTAKPTPVAQNTIVFEGVGVRFATAKWGRVSVGVFDEYKVVINPAGPTIDPNPIPGSTDPPMTDLFDLVDGTQYTLTVITVSGTTESSPSSATFTPQRLPVANPTLTQNVDKVTISWAARAGTMQSIYKVRYHAIFRNPTSAWTEETVTGFSKVISITPGEWCDVQVIAVSGVQSSYAYGVHLVTAPFPPATASVTKSAATNTSIEVTWTAPTPKSYFIKYIINHTKEGATTPSQVEATPTERTKTLSGLEAGVKYNVRIFTLTKRGKMSETSTDTDGTTKPGNVDASSLTIGNTATTTTATLTWGPVTTPFLTYEIAISPTTGGAKANPASVAKGTTRTALESLTPGRLYTITVKTRSATLESDAVTMTFRTKPLRVSSIAIKNPTTTTATITWTPLTLDSKYWAIYKYKVEIVPTGPTVSPSEVRHPSTSTRVTGMTPGTRYTVKVTTIAGTGSPHVAMSDPTEHEFNAKPTPVAQNTIVFENVATTTATAKWSKVSVGVFDEYKISISPTWPTISPNPVPGSTDPPSTALTNLVPGTQYTLTVITVSGTTESTPSSATFTAKPLPVTGVTLTQNVDKMTISWVPGVGSIQSSYKIRYRAIFRNPTSAWTEVTETALSREISITPGGEKYEVEVIAISGDQSSDATTANLVTVPNFLTMDIDLQERQEMTYHVTFSSGDIAQDAGNYEVIQDIQTL